MQRFYRLVLASILFLVVFLPLEGRAGFDPSLKWRTLETPHFALHHPSHLQEAAQKVSSLLEKTYEDMSKEWGVSPWGRTQVVLVDDRDDANGMATVLPYNTIILYLSAPTANSPLATYSDWLEELVTHESIHILHLSDVGYPMKILKFLFGKLIAPNGLSPGWVTEGVATYFETAKTKGGRGRSSFAEMLLRTDILQDDFLPIDKAGGGGYDWPSWLVRYIYGVEFWQYLSKRYGEEKIIQLSHKFGSSPLLFMINRQAKKVYGKSFYKLWEEWEILLRARYNLEKGKLESQGLIEGETLIDQEGLLSQPTFIEGGKKILYLRESSHFRPALWVFDGTTGKSEKFLDKYSPQQMSWDNEGKKLAFASAHKIKRYNYYSDLYLYDTEKKKLKGLTQGKRARDPDFSPDGKKIVFSLHEPMGDRLAVVDVATKEISFLTEPEPYVVIDQPRWSPDGQSIAASVWRSHTRRNIEIFDTQGHSKRVTSNSTSLERHPSWDPKGRFLYYTSDQTGIDNIYRYDVHNGHHEQLTRVLTGASEPAVDPQGERIVFRYYKGGSFEIRSLELKSPLTEVGSGVGNTIADTPVTPDLTGDSFPPLEGKKYNPFKTLFLPRYLVPNVAFVDNSIFASGAVGSYDPLRWHNWYGNVTYRSDNQYIGYGGGYSYQRFWPTFYTGYINYAVNYGNIFGTGNDYFEKRWRAFGGAGIVLANYHSLNTNYFFEDRNADSVIPAGATLVPVEGSYSGFKNTYEFVKTGQTAAAISPEWGQSVRLNFEITDSLLGASSQLERRVFWGDGRQYLRIPGTRHHVLALRLGGGISFGDVLTQGSFGLGGSLGESPLTTASTRVFTMRGLPLVTFSRERVMIFSTEYRLPLFRVQRGLGTTPLFLRSAHMALFSDAGDAWNASQKTGGLTDFFDDFMVSVGLELRGDFVLGYGLPVVGRLGYGILVVNRDRIRILGVADPLTKADARNGVVILEIGTSF